MRLAATESERRLQEEVREFLAGATLDASRLPHALDERIEALRGWQARCYEAGYVGRAWPREFGGGGAPAAEQIVIDQELAAAGAPEFVNVVGLDVLGPSLLRFFLSNCSRTAGSSTSCIKVDFPEPEIPVITDNRPTGKRTSTSFKLFARAPRISIQPSTSRSGRRDFRMG